MVLRVASGWGCVKELGCETEHRGVGRARFNASLLIWRVAMRVRRSGFVAAFAFVVSGLLVWAQVGPAALSDEAQGKLWWAHVQYLADPSMNGRLTGSEEYLKAAAYVVEQFKSFGLTPAGVDGTCYQPVHFDVQRVIASKSSMKLVSGCKTCRFYNEEPLVLGEDAILGSRSA